MTTEQLNMMKEIEIVIAPIIEKYMKNSNLSVPDVVYYTMSESETIALRTARYLHWRILWGGL